MTKKRSFPKDVYYLMKSVDNLTTGQVTIGTLEESEDGEHEGSITMEVAPSDGAFKGGKFKFQICAKQDYPDFPPEVKCLTEIYHPNIDTEEISDDGSNICVSLLEEGEWDSNMTLEHCVQAVLFLFYNPNWGDALSPLFSPDLTEDEFAANVKISLEGGEIDGRYFERNYGLPDVKEIIPSNGEEKKLSAMEKEMNTVNTALSNMMDEGRTGETTAANSAGVESGSADASEVTCEAKSIPTEEESGTADQGETTHTEQYTSGDFIADSTQDIPSNEISGEENLSVSKDSNISKTDVSFDATPEETHELKMNVPNATQSKGDIFVDFPCVQTTKTEQQNNKGPFLPLIKRSLSVGDTPREEVVWNSGKSENILEAIMYGNNVPEVVVADIIDDQKQLLLPECQVVTGKELVPNSLETCCDKYFSCNAIFCFR